MNSMPDDEFTVLTTVYSATEAQLVADLLRNQGIEVVVRPQREYAEFVVGGDRGSFQILVPQSAVAIANHTLAESKTPHLGIVDSHADTNPSDGPETTEIHKSSPRSLKLNTWMIVLVFLILFYLIAHFL